DLWGYAPACCGRLHESVPSSTLAVRRLYVTKGGSPTHRPLPNGDMADSASPRDGFTGLRPDTGKDNTRRQGRKRP
ncbi:hypothetical protein LDZ95_32870, partial [Pseudomonas aeruginosa]|nr:hypothetical protein [Pseudomonas aeruginosa]